MGDKSKLSTTKLLLNQYKGILSDPVEGFTVELEDENDLFKWKVYIEGPKDTCYEGGVFQLRLSFPADYPMLPPTLQFISEFWHPNVHTNGKVCISILHPPGEDDMSGERAGERWLPTQTVSSIMLSVISLLNDPNTSSPANVDASVEWRKDRPKYRARCQQLIAKANAEKPAHVVIPHPDTNVEEHQRHVEKMKILNKEFSIDDFAYEDEDGQDNDPDNDDQDEDFDDDDIEEDEGDEGMEDEEKVEKISKGKEKEAEDKKEKEKGKGKVEDHSEKPSHPTTSSNSIPPTGLQNSSSSSTIDSQLTKSNTHSSSSNSNSPSLILPEGANADNREISSSNNNNSSEPPHPETSRRGKGKVKKVKQSREGRKKDKCVLM
eukprot:TRINITY_DN7299_c0_g1_i1.p1 TRINITY_DN7299_c0_g1~~TRINITY_DN7299_c0_g1_i1.p1  ORF type:complete len:378 (-),score=119.59 TRINITY_DN7299_c0_g1_i1:118-1251(-)